MNTYPYPFFDKTKTQIREILLDKHGVIIYPTETFYALGCAATCPIAVNKIYSLKKRDHTMPLLVLVNDWEMFFKYTSQIHHHHMELLKKHWPGPLTAILPKRGNLAKELNYQGEFLGFRMTSSKIAKELIEISGVPLVGTSANISSQREADKVVTAQKTFGNSVEIYIDGGITPAVKPSTIVDMTKESYTVVREGMISL